VALLREIAFRSLWMGAPAHGGHYVAAESSAGRRSCPIGRAVNRHTLPAIVSLSTWQTVGEHDSQASNVRCVQEAAVTGLQLAADDLLQLAKELEGDDAGKPALDQPVVNGTSTADDQSTEAAESQMQLEDDASHMDALPAVRPPCI
jgi:hypothetical protein